MIKKKKFKISEFIDFLSAYKDKKGDFDIYYKNLPILCYVFLTEKADLSEAIKDDFDKIKEIFYKVRLK